MTLRRSLEAAEAAFAAAQRDARSRGFSRQGHPQSPMTEYTRHWRGICDGC